MGYGHYWAQSGQIEPSPAWNNICRDVAALFADCGLDLAKEMDSNEPPLIDEDKISFNGATLYDGFDDFVLLREANEDLSRCKTSGQPYDPLVCAVLAVVSAHAPDNIRIKSDGSVEDWDVTSAWASEVLDRFIPNPLISQESRSKHKPTRSL